jgi:hypothetical protein
VGDRKSHPKTVRFVAAFSQYESQLDWLWSRVVEHWGPLLMQSERFSFAESQYYRRTMGENLLKQFAVLDSRYDPATLADDKSLANQWEEEAKGLFPVPEERPLNIDPGYMSLTKLVLASTKNREHRVYLRDGVYAEVTLAFRDQHWQPMSWTYPDYQRDDFRRFFAEARKVLFASG